ncbi:MAG: hypothetical protein NVS3B3_12600 [Aquirhabdus sp.]
MSALLCLRKKAGEHLGSPLHIIARRFPSSFPLRLLSCTTQPTFNFDNKLQHRKSRYRITLDSNFRLDHQMNDFSKN